MIRVFKSTSNSQDLVELDTGAIMENHFKGRKTSIIIDTNIMLYIEDAYHSGERHKKLKDWGVLHLAKMVRKNGKYGVFLSPGAAFLELPPSRRKNVETAFDRFLQNYLPNFSYDPNSKRTPYETGSQKPEAFTDLSPDQQKLVSCSYASLLALNIIGGLEDLNEIEKFTLYLDYCAEVLDLVSLKELTIARYAFASERGITESVRRKIVATRSNFLKIKRGAKKGLSASEVKKRIAMNGANDLRIISMSDILNNSHEVFDIDAWIATNDDKLFEFCCACPGFFGPERGGPLARHVETHSDINGTIYWRESIDLQKRRLAERLSKVFIQRSVDSIVMCALELEAHLENNTAMDYLRSRAWRSVNPWVHDAAN